MGTIRKTNHPRLFVSIIFSILISFSLVTPEHAQAATLIVNTLTDENDGSCSDGDCSLRDAIQVATAGDTITFSVSGTIVLTLGELTVDKDLTIIGPGPDNLTVSGNNNSRVFIVTGGSTTFSGLTIADGYDNFFGGGMFNLGTSMLMDVTFSGNSARDGGGMYNFDGCTSTLTDVTFSGNVAVYGGGGMYNSSGTSTLTNVTFSGNSAGGGGGMFDGGTSTLTNVTFNGNSAGQGGGMESDGSSTLTNVTFSDNQASYFGGGMYKARGTSNLTNVTFSDNSAGSEGGGMESYLTSTLTNVTFSGNSAPSGGGMSNIGTSTLTNVTFSGNIAVSTGGGGGGGMFNFGTSTLTNVTFSGNSSDNGGGIDNSYGTSTLTNVTFSGNSAGSGGGVFVQNESSLILKNTLLAGGDAPNGPDCFGTVTSYGYNLIQNTNGCTLTGDQTGNIYGENPLLGPLAHNGGFTMTHGLLHGSPAIDAASSTDPYGNPVTVDQRGVSRPQGVANDIGAFEFVNQMSFWLPVVLK
jgi:CSLREA domain-containing protein